MKLITRAVTLVAALSLASTAQAQDIRFAGTAAGGFNGATPNLSSMSCTTLLAGLTYCGSTFDNTTVNGFAGFGGNPAPGANFNNFGSFQLANSNIKYNGNTFDLYLTFSQPTGITPSGATQTFTSAVKGSVNSNGNGGVQITFDPASMARAFEFTASQPSGMPGRATLMVNNVAIDAGQTASVTGNVTASVVPEPSTYALMAAGLAGLGVVARRRRTA